MNEEKPIIAERIKLLRKEKGYTQEQLADLLGLNAKSSIANYESGANAPSDEIKAKICELFNCTMDYLMGKSEFKTDKENFDNYMTNQNKLTILKTIYEYHQEYVIPCCLKEKDIDYIVELLSNVTEQNKKETKEKINSYVNSFDVDKRKKIRDFINIIIKEMINDLEDKSRFHYFATLLDKENSKNKDINTISNKLFNIPVLGKIAAGQPILAEEYLEGYLPVDPNIYGMTTPDDYFYLKVSGESMNLKVHNGDYALIHKQDYADDGDIIVAIVNGNDEATLKKYKRINENTIALEPMSTLPMETIYIDLKDKNFKIIGKAIGQFGKF